MKIGIDKRMAIAWGLLAIWLLLAYILGPVLLLEIFVVVVVGVMVVEYLTG